MKSKTYFFQASGHSYDACFYLGRQHNLAHEQTANKTESWIMGHHRTPKGRITASVYYQSNGLLTGLWQAGNGAVFATRASMPAILFHPDPSNDSRRPFQEIKISECMPQGIWGLHEQFVMAWGIDSNNISYLYLYKGTKWEAIAAPGFPIKSVHGIAENLILAVGQNGGIARWNGSRWKQYSQSGNEAYNGVFVVSINEIFVVGNNGSVLAGNPRTFKQLKRQNLQGAPLQAIAKWDNYIWIAAGESGLFTLQPKSNELELYNEEYRASGFDTRFDFIVACEDKIVGMNEIQEDTFGKGYLLI